MKRLFLAWGTVATLFCLAVILESSTKNNFGHWAAVVLGTGSVIVTFALATRSK